MAKRVLFACAAAIAGVRGIKVGDMLPAATLDLGFGPPEAISTVQLCMDKKIVLIPGYLEKEAELKAAGVDDIVIFSVNDGAVQQAWAKDQGVDKDSGYKGSIHLLADTRMELTKALGTVLNHDGPMGVLGNNRCQRFSMYIVNCKVAIFNICNKDNDPAGDDFPEVTLAEKMLEDIKAHKHDEL